jgi:GH35 family endo-1,4-beta-xylanase
MSRFVGFLARGSVVAICVVTGAIAVPPCALGDDASLWAEAESRIDRHRRTDVSVEVLDPDGRPLADAVVHLEQTRHAFLFGCNIYAFGRTGDDALESSYRTRFARLFNFATLPFYWASYERQAGEPNHERTRQIAAWCHEQGITCKGHPLAWNYADPRWLPEDSRRIFDLQLDRIDDCVTRFASTIGIWDVVNEATHFDRESFQRRAPRMTQMWSDIGQIAFARACFERARRANPDAVLLINDYRVDAKYERVIEQLVDEKGKRLYDVIGIQSHQHGGTWANQRIWDVCQRFSRFGVPLHFTETTILSGPRRPQGQKWETTPDDEQRQAQEVERFYTMLYSHPAVEAITWWDFSDLRAWQSAPAGLLRKDMSPKPAYERLQKLIKGKWWTQAELRTGSDGRAVQRATYGDYTVTVDHGGKRVATKQIRVVKGEENRVTVRITPDAEREE